MYSLLPREQFSYSVVWWGIVPSSLAQALFLTRKTIGEQLPREKTIIAHIKLCRRNKALQ